MSADAEPDRPLITDKRRVDRGGDAPATAPTEAPDQPDAAPEDPNVQLLVERTADLQRLQAEYANYRRRAERDRLAAGELGVDRALVALLPVQDDIDRAREHGDLTGGLKAIAESLEASLAKLGLAAFGEAGDPFDPAVHEAALHQQAEPGDESITVPTCTMILRRGYRHGERLLRAAMVGVTDPAPPAEPADTDTDTELDPPRGPAEDVTD